jgi:hypothetical protein
MQIENYTVQRLKDELKSDGLSIKGNKKVLFERLQKVCYLSLFILTEPSI